MTRAIAIDFGTSRTKLAYAPGDGGRPELMRFGNDRPFVRSLIYLPPGSTDILWGEDAEHRLASDPGGIIDVPKRRLAEPWLRAAGGRKETPQQVLTVVFSDLRRWAGERIKAFAGQPPERLTLTLPGLYRPVEERTVRAAAAAAGFAEDAITPIAEPVAAAQAWLAETGGDGDDVIVLDAGGGTFDWAWLRRQDGTFHLVPDCPPGGDRELGGHDVDLLLFDLLQEKAGDTAAPAILARRAHWLDRLRALKEDYCLGHPLRPLPVEGREVMISEREIEGAIEQRFVVQVCDALAGYLDKVRTIAGGGLPAVLLVGGSGRLRGLATALNQRLGCTTVQWDRAEFATALGCIPWKKKRVDVMDKTIITCPACKQKMRVPALGEINATCPHCREKLSVRDGKMHDDILDADYDKINNTDVEIAEIPSKISWYYFRKEYMRYISVRFSRFEAQIGSLTLSGIDGRELLEAGLADDVWFGHRYAGICRAKTQPYVLLAANRVHELRKWYTDDVHGAQLIWVDKHRARAAFLSYFLTGKNITCSDSPCPDDMAGDDFPILEAIFAARMDDKSKAVRLLNECLEYGQDHYRGIEFIVEIAKAWKFIINDQAQARKCLKLAENHDIDKNMFFAAEGYMALFGDVDKASSLLLMCENVSDPLWVVLAEHWLKLLGNRSKARLCLEREEEESSDHPATRLCCAEMWNLLGDKIKVHKSLANSQTIFARSDATTVTFETLCEISEWWRDVACDETGVRRCLEFAEYLAPQQRKENDFDQTERMIICAKAWHKMFPRQGNAERCLRNAEPDSPFYKYWELAEIWRQLGNFDESARLRSVYESHGLTDWVEL